jgi:hypothetical protein
VAQAKYRIELRQIEVKGLNARHYFWVKTKVEPHETGEDSSNEEKVTVLGELHGFPYDREMDQYRGFSMGGDELQMPDRRYRVSAYNESLRLPRAIAFEGTKAEVDARWNAGHAMGEYVNKTRTEYNPLGNNSNAMATTIGKAMGFRPRKVLDPRVGGEAVQPFTPGLGRDLSAGRRDAPRSSFSGAPKDVGGYGQLDRIEGKEQILDPFADPFRTDTPL